MEYNMYKQAEKECERAWDTHSQSKTECPFCGEMVIAIRIVKNGYEDGFCPKCRRGISSCEVDKAGLPINWMTK